MKKSILKYGWEYAVDDKQNLIIEPNPSEKKPKPKSLFKYYKLDSLSIDALSKCYIYAPHPEQLNDPIDCNHAMIVYDDPKFVHNILKEIQPNSSFEHTKQIVEKQDPSILRDVQYYVKQILYARMGIISLCNNVDSMLMWTYYTEHRGYCIEFDYQKFPFKPLGGPFQINYQEKIEPISVTNSELAFLYQTNVKAKCWEHESEWRILVEKEGPNKRMLMPGIKGLEGFQGVDRKFEYFSDNILSITLGYRFFEQDALSIDDEKVHLTLKKEIALKEIFLSICETEGFQLYMIVVEIKTFTFLRRPIDIKKIDGNKYIIRYRKQKMEETLNKRS